MGIVSNIDKVFSGRERSWKIVFSDPWYYLAHCYALNNGWEPTFGLRPRESVSGIIPKISLSQALSSVLNMANHHPAAYELRISDDKLLIPWNASCDTLESLLQSIRRWSPRMVSYYDYTGAQPKLVITDYDALEPISLPLQPSETVASIEVSLAPRGDLVPPCVAIVAESSGSNGFRVSYLSKYPADGDPTLPHSIVYRVSSDFYYSAYNESGGSASEPQPVKTPRSGSLAYQKMIVKGRRIDAADMINSFWAHHFPWMKDIPTGQLVTYSDRIVTPKDWEGAEEDKPKGYDTTATGYELTDGQIHTKSLRPKWCNTTIKQRLAIPENAPAKWREKFKNIGEIGNTSCFWQEFSVDLVTIDRPNTTYPIDGIYNGEQPSNDEDGPSDAPNDGIPYSDVAKTVWESMQELPYDGSITFAARGGAQYWQYMGRRVSLRGGDPEWEHINTMVQTVSRDFQTNVIELSYGSPSQLGVEDLLELNQVNADSHASSTLENMQGAPEPVNLTYDPKPESPTISQQITAATGSEAPAPEYGFQVRLTKDTEGNITDARIKPGAIYLNGHLLGFYPAGGGGAGSSWTKLPMISGEVWINVHFDKDAKLTGVDVSGIPGTVYPIMLAQEKPGVNFDYAFQIAEIEDDQVTQYALGMIQIPVFGGTYYPYGPS